MVSTAPVLHDEYFADWHLPLIAPTAACVDNAVRSAAPAPMAVIQKLADDDVDFEIFEERCREHAARTEVSRCFLAGMFAMTDG